MHSLDKRRPLVAGLVVWLDSSTCKHRTSEREPSREGEIKLASNREKALKSSRKTARESGGSRAEQGRLATQ